MKENKKVQLNRTAKPKTAILNRERGLDPCETVR